MADTETAQETVPDTTVAVKGSEAEENNNSADSPAAVDEKPTDGEPISAESGEVEKPEDSQPEQVPEGDQTDAPQEAVEPDQPSEPAGGEEQTVDAPKPDEDGPTSSEGVEEAAKEGEVPEDAPQEVVVDSQETPAPSVVIEDEKPEEETSSPKTDEVAVDEVADELIPEKVHKTENPVLEEPRPEKVPETENSVLEEPTPERAADEIDGDATESEKQIEQPQEDQSNIHENEEKPEDSNVEDTSKELDLKAKDDAPVDISVTVGDVATADIHEAVPEDIDEIKPVDPEPQEPPQETTTEEAQPTTRAEEGETSGENVHEIGTFEEKYSAAQRDIQELRALNVEIQQRLDKSEAESKDRKRQSSVDNKEGMKVQSDYLARELSQQQDTEKYLREKLAETLEEKEESERKCKDLQLRLKRFAKDDQAKDERMKKLESDLRDISQEVQTLEEHFDEETLKTIRESKGTNATNGQTTTARTQQKQETPVPQSKTCTIL
ncbi:uncharacterized protein [Asterias amurensis]|uniref:uncharacterized protein n=1 Tax=Asterias amurensis TaxID=7602 RepID=UPI003AB2F6A5